MADVVQHQKISICMRLGFSAAAGKQLLTAASLITNAGCKQTEFRQQTWYQSSCAHVLWWTLTFDGRSQLICSLGAQHFVQGSYGVSTYMGTVSLVFKVMERLGSYGSRQVV